jgi:DNA-binding LacI/PurR family transcriptional regulator
MDQLDIPPTLKDVALAAKVSTQTVSRVINNHPDVAADTRQRVLATIEEIGYHPNALARRLKYGRTNTIGFILPDISNPFFGNAISAANHYIKNSEYADYELLFYNTEGNPEWEKKALDFMIERQMEGIIIASSASEFIIEHIRQILNQKKIVIVAMDNQLGDLNIDLVTSDNFLGAYKLTTHLIGLKHKSIAVITGPDNESSSIERLEGYKAALKEYGIAFDEEITFVGNWTRASGISATERLLQLKSRPTAIFGFNNSLSMGALTVLKSQSIKVPEDMALVSFDDVEYGDLLSPALTTTSTSWYELGRVSASLLLDRLASGNSKTRQCIKLPMELIIRESCGFL